MPTIKKKIYYMFFYYIKNEKNKRDKKNTPSKRKIRYFDLKGVFHIQYSIFAKSNPQSLA